jgi:peptide/nickel transport system permease protein
MRKPPSVQRRIIRFLRKKPLGAAGLLIILLMIAVALTAQVFYPAGPNAGSSAIIAPPGGRFLLGSDNLGRDVLARILFGTRTSLTVGLVAVGVGVTGGLIVGLISGYAGGKVDMVIQRLVDSLMAFPALVLALAMVAVLGQSTINVMIAVGITFIPTVSRVVRGTVLSAKENQYVEAARCLGCQYSRIVFRHIMPNVLAPVIILATAGLGYAIVVEATLSYLGLGPPPPAPTWGGMMQEGRKYMYMAWWIVLYPGIAISIAVYGFNLFGDALRDVLDPRLRGR